jgi:hypothetical protein
MHRFPADHGGLAALASLLLLAIPSACASQAGDELVPSTSGARAAPLEVFPAAAHTGVDDAGAAYRLILLASPGDGETIFSATGAQIRVQGSGQQATVSALAAGAATVLVSRADSRVEVPVRITGYSGAERMLGAAAYARHACQSCHEAVDISPSGVAEHSDAELIAATVDGVNPEGGPVDSPDHRYALSAAERRGLAAYLRALPPRGLPGVDE